LIHSKTTVDVSGRWRGRERWGGGDDKSFEKPLNGGEKVENCAIPSKKNTPKKAVPKAITWRKRVVLATKGKY